MRIEWQRTDQGESDCFDRVPKGAEITSVNGEMVVGMCESCGDCIFLAQPYWHDDEGIRWHKKCPTIDTAEGEDK